MQSDEQPIHASEDGEHSGLIRAQLERMLASSGFAQSTRMRRFLKFVVECSLNRNQSPEREQHRRGSFDRAPSYDPKTEPIVRTEAHSLREKIREYYEGEGSSDRVVISLPKGGYAPRF